MPKVGEPISEESEKIFKTKFHVSWYYIRWFSCREEKKCKNEVGNELTIKTTSSIFSKKWIRIIR